MGFSAEIRVDFQNLFKQLIVHIILCLFRIHVCCEFGQNMLISLVTRANSMQKWYFCGVYIKT